MNFGRLRISANARDILVSRSAAVLTVGSGNDEIDHTRIKIMQSDVCTRRGSLWVRVSPRIVNRCDVLS